MFFSMRRLTLCDGKNTCTRAKWITERLQTHVLQLTSEAIGPSAGIAGPDAVRSRDAERCAVVVHEGQAGGGLRGRAGDRGALGALEPASAYPDDLGWDDPAAAVAGGGLLPLHGVAQEMAVSSL